MRKLKRGSDLVAGVPSSSWPSGGLRVCCWEVEEEACWPLEEPDDPDCCPAEVVGWLPEESELLLLLELPPGLPVQEEANTWSLDCTNLLLISSGVTDMYQISHAWTLDMVNIPLPTWLRADCMSPVRPPDPLTVTEARLWELLPAPPATNATVNCSSESTPFLPSWAGTPPEASSRWGVGGSGAEALSDPGRDENWSFQHFSKLHLTKSGLMLPRNTGRS